MIDSRFQFSLRIKIFLYWGPEVSGTIYLQMILEKANQRTTYLIFLSFLPVQANRILKKNPQQLSHTTGGKPQALWKNKKKAYGFPPHY